MLYAALSGHGVYKSTDGGSSWTQASSGLPDLLVEKSSSMSMHQTNSGRSLQALVSSSLSTPEQPGSTRARGCPVQREQLGARSSGSEGARRGTTADVYRSGDGGSTWEVAFGDWGPGPSTGSPWTFPTIWWSTLRRRLSSTDRFMGTLDRAGTRPWARRHPRPGHEGGETPALWVGGQEGVYRSTDQGQTWQPAGLGDELVQTLCIAASPERTPTIYVGSDRGLFRGRAGSGEWDELERGINVSWVSALATDPSNPRRALVGVSNCRGGSSGLSTAASPGSPGVLGSSPPGGPTRSVRSPSIGPIREPSTRGTMTLSTGARMVV